MSIAYSHNSDFTELNTFEIIDIETEVKGSNYILRFLGTDKTVEIIMDEAGVVKHNRLTLEFIKGFTYGRLHRNGKS